MSLPAVSKHLRVLERAGLVAKGRAAQYRPCRLQPAPIRDVADWAERYRDVWEGRLDRLGSYLNDLTSNDPIANDKESLHGRQPRRK
jgi:DNA-binding transcriptional ArsR family regulator